MTLDKKFKDTVNLLIDQIEGSSTRWKMPWHGKIKQSRNISNGQNYSGLNQLLLIDEQQGKQYKSNAWGTLRQWNARGNRVILGQKAVTLYMPIFRENKNGKQGVRYFKRFWVFNGDQVTNFNPDHPDLFGGLQVRRPSIALLLEHHKPTIHFGAEKASYSLKHDQISMPDRDNFVGSVTSTPEEAFYGTLLHELVHWTRHPTRVDRPVFPELKKVGYAFEELIAEIGSAFLCCKLSISNTPREDHAQYLKSWLGVLRDNPAHLWEAATKAQKAVDFILQYISKEPPRDYYPPFDLEVQPVQTDLFYRVL